MFDWLYDLPTWLSALIFAVAFPGVTLIGLLLTRWLLSRWIHRETRANDMVGMALASFSVMYGILVGLVAVGAYTHYDAMNTNVSEEASSLASLYRDTYAFPEPLRDRLQQDIREYARYTIQVGWPAQRRGVTPTGGTQRVSQLLVDLVSFEPRSEREQTVFAEAFARYNQMVDLRRARLAAVGAGLPPVLWWVMLLGAGLNLILIWLLNMDVHVHMILASVLSIFLGSVIFLTAVLDMPFRGEISVSPEPLQLVYRTLMGGT